VKDVAPKRKLLVKADAKLKEAREELKLKQLELQAVNDNVAALKKKV